MAKKAEPKNIAYCAYCRVPFELPDEQVELLEEWETIELNFHPIHKTEIKIIRAVLPKCPLCQTLESKKGLGIGRAKKNLDPIPLIGDKEQKPSDTSE